MAARRTRIRARAHHITGDARGPSVSGHSRHPAHERPVVISSADLLLDPDPSRGLDKRIRSTARGPTSEGEIRDSIGTRASVHPYAERRSG